MSDGVSGEPQGTSDGEAASRNVDQLRRLLAPSWWLIALMSLSVLSVVFGAVTKVWRHDQLDLHVYIMGASHLFDGTIYLVRSVQAPHLLFTYTPFAGLFFYPLSVVSFAVAQGVWFAISMAALVAVVALSLWSVRPDLDRRELWTATAVVIGPMFWLEPVEANFRFGQINVVLVLMVFADLMLTLRVRGRTFPKGILIGVASAVKLIPLVFVAYLFVTRQRRYAWTALSSFVACTAFAALCNARVTHDYWTKYAFDTKRIGGIFYLSNQSLRGSLDRLSHTVIGNGLSTALAAAMLIGGLVLARWAYVSSSPLLGVLVTATTGMLASPITWTHHLIWVIPILAWLALAHDRPSRGPAWALLVAVVIWMSPMWLVSSIPVDELHENVIESIAANSYFLVLVGFLVGVACMLWRRQRGALQREARGPHAAPAKNAQ